MKRIKKSWNELKEKSLQLKTKEWFQLKGNLHRRIPIKFTFILSALVFTSCVTAPKNFTQVDRGTWKSKVYVNDKVNKKKAVLDVTFKASKNEKLRMDVVSPVGGHLASLVLKQDDVEYLLIKRKKYYSGKASSSSLSPLFKLPLNPQWLYSVLYDTRIKNKNWICTNEDTFLLECQNLKDRVRLSWKHRRGNKKTVVVSHKTAELEIKFNEYTEEIKNEKKAFKLRAPRSFKKISLN